MLVVARWKRREACRFCIETLGSFQDHHPRSAPSSVRGGHE
uniref:Uncharacterized protein n=1 Tax=Anopheles dirus TaxID=7168 RepID=A0A182NYM9_9DIPT